MRRYLLDTNIWIGLANSEPLVVERIQSIKPTQVFCCSVVRAELLFGARKSQRVDANLVAFEQMLRPFESAPFDAAAAGQYGLIRLVLERAGKPIGANDMMIAAIALLHDFVLVTRNTREFARVPGIRLEEW